jgi:hypothetical protein
MNDIFGIDANPSGLVKIHASKYSGQLVPRNPGLDAAIPLGVGNQMTTTHRDSLAFHRKQRGTHFSPQNSIFVDFFGAETQAGAGITLHKQKAMVNDFELLNYDPHPAIKAPATV